MAKEISKVIGQDNAAEETIAEGQEPGEFWVLLGGKTPYANDKRYAVGWRIDLTFTFQIFSVEASEKN